MAYLILPSRRTRQPQGAVNLDPRYGLYPDFVFNGRDSGGFSTSNLTLKNYAWGVGADTTSGASSPLSKGVRTTGQNKVTFIAIASKTANNAYANIINFGGFSLINGDGDTTSIGIQKNGVIALTGVNVALNVPTVLVGSHDVASGQYYLLARPLAGGSVLRSAGTNTQAANVGTTAYIQGNPSPNDWNGAIGLAVGSFSWLPESEAYDLLGNPWQIFAPNIRRIYFGVSGGVTTTDAAIAGTQATDVGAITVEATTGAAIAGTQAADVGAVTVEATTGAAIAGTQASDIAAIDVTASTGQTDAAMAGTQAPDVGAITVEATLGLTLSATQASDVGYIVVEATLPASMAGTQDSDVAAITVTAAGTSIWTDISGSTTSWADQSAASTIWTDL